ncbi:hypothetical protein BH23CHL5_BH23CHL5_26860 [soil metagenome]
MAHDTTALHWPPATHEDYDVLVGQDVFSSEGEKVGTISSVFHPNTDIELARGNHYFLLNPGLLKDWFGGMEESYLPETAISGVTKDGLQLNLSESDIKNLDWAEPVGIAGYRRS